MLKAFLISVFILCMAAITKAQENRNGTLLVGNIEREYVLHLPKNYKSGKALPLMMVFHGGGGNHKQIQRYMGMDSIADKENFITVYPNGINKQWNDGREFKESISANDDVQFINQLLDTLVKNYAVDSSRIFSTGISNGGFFSIYLSYKMSKRLLAIAPVCASIPERLWKEFYPSQPVSILIMNGTQDPLVKYGGGPVGTKLTGERGFSMHTDSSIKRYIMVNGTTSTPATEFIPDKNRNDQCTAVKYLYTGGLNHSKVCLVKINKGGHTLPGASQYLPKAIIGRVCNDFKGNEMIWEFFKGCGK